MVGCIVVSTIEYVMYLRYEQPMSFSLPDGHMMMLIRLVALLVLSIVLICPIDDTIQGAGFTHFYRISLRNLVTIIPLSVTIDYLTTIYLTN